MVDHGPLVVDRGGRVGVGLDWTGLWWGGKSWFEGGERGEGLGKHAGVGLEATFSKRSM